jgi:tetratricopeptide (TPR) repeat protein
LNRAYAGRAGTKEGIASSAGAKAVESLAARRFEKVIEWADRALHDQPRFIVAVRVKIVALANLGRLDEAHAELGRMLALNPGLTIAALRPTTVSFDPEYAQFALAGLRLADLPEE